MAFVDARVGDGPFGAHAELQHRNHDLGADLQQLLLRTSARYTLPESGATFALGYGFIHAQREGDRDAGVDEHRIYQEAVLGQRVGRVRIGHRFRYEQRFVENVDLQTRARYLLSATVPLSRAEMTPGTVFASLYTETFLNVTGLDRADGTRIPVFGTNRLYAALGYQVTPDLSVRAGYMEQVFDQDRDGQLQFSLHYAFQL